ncbi:MAG: tyrosine-type recombinase/integrase [Actinomycetota bacterium]|nr:tyrosine-type recombinase/integrase [Actinomycetota bacterium]
MIWTAGVLGLRWSEVTGLRVGRIDLLRRTIKIVETNPAIGAMADTKTRSSRRTLTMPTLVADELAAHLARQNLTAADPDRLVFAAPEGGRLIATNFNQRDWQPALKAAGITGFTFHGLRHSSVAYQFRRRRPPPSHPTTPRALVVVHHHGHLRSHPARHRRHRHHQPRPPPRHPPRGGRPHDRGEDGSAASQQPSKPAGPAKQGSRSGRYRA